MNNSERNIVVFGPPGVGKGTQAEILSRETGLVHLSTGEMIREEIARGTPLGRRVKKAVEKGGFADDEIVLELILDWIDRPDLRSGFIMDGFPRNVEQARRFDEVLGERGRAVTHALFIVAPDETALRRLAGRSQGREDDSPEVHLDRVRTYHEQTAPMAEYYRDSGTLIEIDGDRTIDEVAEEIRGILAAA